MAEQRILKCPCCHGRGHIRLFGVFARNETCEDCGGTGGLAGAVLSGQCNATCDGCNQFRPRCKSVRLRDDGASRKLCEACRKQLRGQFRLEKE